MKVVKVEENRMRIKQGSERKTVLYTVYQNLSKNPLSLSHFGAGSLLNFYFPVGAGLESLRYEQKVPKRRKRSDISLLSRFIVPRLFATSTGWGQV
ncbi:hypothetical protein CEXT_447241 [Caerostris extrusa]|uniref:Uncharacterized protein n=1 Tax=Caerostris extrusa TaxID=172846 RepID=A0AAV4QVX7_CAEEX|nr:hypothetical protein CEXT_447241 [Caerostris extrusa]